MGGNTVIVFVVVEHRDTGAFRGRCDEQVGMTDRTMVEAASPGELLVDA
jgi:hypothetical protein